ncbi:DUF4362 domain-containing protein [Lysinibacillus sp. NPDC056185]|uniref:DUF4362 domain-containing protein n=1 Tax=Lysinibacillus sp. NPDC056185 TaxID=3345739 RepID=UPI0039EEE662
MKKLTVLFFILLIAGCDRVNSSTDIDMNVNDEPSPYISTPEDIVDTHGEIKNLERFEDFFRNVQLGKEDSIRVAKYTIEGDPILHELKYDGKIIKSTYDSRRDQFGQGSIIHSACSLIDTAETNESTNYLLRDCEPPIENSSILVIEK